MRPIDRFEHFLRTNTALVDSSIHTYMKYARAIARSRLRPAEWLAASASPNQAPNTIEGKLTVARYFHAWLQSENVRDPGPVPQLGFGPSRDRSSQVKPLDERQLKVFLKAIEAHTQDPWKTILLLTPLTGLRVATLCAAERRALGRSPQAGGYGLRVPRGRGQPARWVPFGEDARGVLRAYLVTHSEPSRWVFPSSAVYQGRKIEHAGARQAERILGRLREAQNWPAAHTAAALRTTFRARMTEAGATDEAVGGIMGSAAGAQVPHQALVRAVRLPGRLLG